jgi:hypothetical protein
VQEGPVAESERRRRGERSGGKTKSKSNLRVQEEEGATANGFVGVADDRSGMARPTRGWQAKGKDDIIDTVQPI